MYVCRVDACKIKGFYHASATHMGFKKLAEVDPKEYSHFTLLYRYFEFEGDRIWQSGWYKYSVAGRRWESVSKGGDASSSSLSHATTCRKVIA